MEDFSFYIPYMVLFTWTVLAYFLVKNIMPDYTNMVSANHSMDWVQSGFSITATFVVSSMMLLSAGFSYTYGIMAPLSLIVAYAVSYYIYGHYASLIKHNNKSFVTLSDVMNEKIGKVTGLIMKSQFTIAPVYSIIINLLGIKLALQVFGFDTNDQIIFSTIASALVISYCWRGGLVSSIRTDVIQTLVLIVTGIVIFAAVTIGNTAPLVAFLDRPLNWDAVANPGLLFFFIFSAALFADIELHNRISAMKSSVTVKKSFKLAAILTAIPVILYGLLGGYAIGDISPATSALPTVIENMDTVIQVIFILMIIVLLTSNLDSSLVASATMITEEWTPEKNIKIFRLAMIGTAIFAIGIASLNIRLVEIFMIYAAVRLATLPVIIAFAKQIVIDDKKWAWFFLASIVLGAIALYTIKMQSLPIAYTLMSYIGIVGISSLGLLRYGR